MYKITVTDKIDVVFKSAEEKEKYLCGEYKFTYQEYRNFCSAFGDEREDARKKLIKKRFEFYKKYYKDRHNNNTGDSAA